MIYFPDVVIMHVIFPFISNFSGFFQAPNNLIEYELAGEGNAPTYFYVDPETGEITLRESVLSTENTVYRVSDAALLCYPTPAAISNLKSQRYSAPCMFI